MEAKTTLAARQSKEDIETPRHVFIAGAGIMGISTAYYLSERYNITCTLMDPTGVLAPAASGKAGGFLALDWNDLSPLGAMARRSFALHAQLADTFGPETIEYRRLECAAIKVSPRRKASSNMVPGLEWVKAETALQLQSLGDESTIAQVHPKKLCEQLWAAAERKGCTFRQAKVKEAVLSEDGVFQGVRLDDGTLVEATSEKDALLVACGPWAANLMKGVKYHSVIVPTDRVLKQCVFFSGCGDPEVYVRPDQTAYCTGFPDPPTAVTESPGQEEVRPNAIQRIVQAVEDAGGDLFRDKDQSKWTKQACYLPTTPDDLPLMGKWPGTTSCYVAAGHSCWGILLGPATGECMAELIATGKSSNINLRTYDPSRFRGIRAFT